MYQGREEMALRRKFKALEMTTWFRAKRGGKESREQKDVPSVFRNRTAKSGTEGKRQDLQEGSSQEKPGNKKAKTIVVETVAFIPYTPDSVLKLLLQKVDDDLSATFNRPKVRFVERGGNQIVKDVGRPNPWSSDFYFKRDECQVCSGRLIVEAKKEEAALAMVGKGDGNPKPIRKEDQVALPGCTREGVVYALECRSCRNKGLRRQYISETSRSGFQRAKEHKREVEEGITTHPMVIHFLEDHQGEEQETVFRLLSKHRTALDCQVMELVRIEETATNPQEALNLRSEWGGSKLPSLHVLRPKGMSDSQNQGEGKRIRFQTKEESSKEEVTDQNSAKRLKMEPKEEESKEDTQEEEREQIIVCRKVEVSRTRTSPQVEKKEGNKEGKPKTFTQLRLDEVLAKKDCGLQHQEAAGKETQLQ